MGQEQPVSQTIADQVIESAADQVLRTIIQLFPTPGPPLPWGSWELVGILGLPVWCFNSTLEQWVSWEDVLIRLGRFF